MATPSLALIPTGFKAGKLYSVLPTPIYGSELVTNVADRTFTSDTGFWSKTSGTTIDTVQEEVDYTSVGGGGGLYKNSFLNASKEYLVSFEITKHTSGNIKVDSSGTVFSSVGSYTKTVTNQNQIYFLASGNFTGSITNVSVKELIVGTGDFDVTRASTATRVNEQGLIESMAINVPRLDYTDGGCPVLLTEPQSTNLVLYSESYNTGWRFQSGDISDGGVGLFYLSPLSKVIKYEATSVNYNQFYYQLPSVITIGNTYTMQGYVKCIDAPYIHFQVNPNSAFIVWDNIGKTVVSSTSGIDSFEIISLNDGWVWASITFTALNSTTYASLKPYLSTSSTGAYSGVPIGTIAYQTFVQVEALPYATSYIPTNGSTVTRVKDVVNNAGDVSTFNSEEGVLFVEMAALKNNSGTFRQISLNGVSGYEIAFFYDNSSRIGVVMTVNNVTSTILYFSINQVDFYNFAFRWSVDNFSLWVDGTKVQEDLSGNTFSPNDLSTLRFLSITNANTFFGKTKQLKVFKTALTDAELTALTS